MRTAKSQIRLGGHADLSSLDAWFCRAAAQMTLKIVNTDV